MSSTSKNTIETNNKDIFVDLLTEEAKNISFLRVIRGTRSEMMNNIENSNGARLIECPDRKYDDYCLNKEPSYKTITKSHFKPPFESYYNSNRCQWIADAIKAAWMDYDPSIPYDHGDISKMVWYRYRQARRHVRDEDIRRIREERERQEAAYREMKRIANLKKREKEEQQFLDLADRNPSSYNGISRMIGESDQAWGMRCFNARMRVDQRIKNAKVKELPNEAALLRFKQWLRDNPNYGDYGTDQAERKMKFSSFMISNSFLFTADNSARYKIPHNYMHSLLDCLANHGFARQSNGVPNYTLKPDNFSVTVTVEWPRENSEGFPINSEIGYSTSVYPWTRLQGNDRTQTPLTMQIRGMFWEKIKKPLYGFYPHEEVYEDRLALISNIKRNVRKMLPKEYSEFEHMNNAKLFNLRECRKLPKGCKITNIKVHVRSICDFPYLEFRGSTMTEQAISDWIDKVGYTDSSDPNFARYYYDLNDPEKKLHKEREVKVDNTLTRVRAVKAANAAAAREAGLKKSRETVVPKAPAAEKIKQLMDLLNLKDRGVISESEYVKLKAELV